MAKGQQRKNKEVKKPKQDKKVIVVSGSVIPKPITSKKQALFKTAGDKIFYFLISQALY